MSDKKIQLLVVSQEKELLDTQVDQVIVPSSSGELTILPDHIPLLSQLATGELIYSKDGKQSSIVISRGFLNMSPENKLTVIVDAAVHERDISEKKAQEAIRQAQETMSSSTDQRELLLAEASLKQALWEVRVAQKTKKSTI